MKASTITSITITALAMLVLMYLLFSLEKERNIKYKQLTKEYDSAQHSIRTKIFLNKITEEELLYTTSSGDVLKTGILQRETGLYRIWWTENNLGHIVEFKVEK